MLYLPVVIICIWIFPKIILNLIKKYVPNSGLIGYSKGQWILFFASAIVAFFLFYPGIEYSSGIGNFWLHFFGGGVVCALIYEYLKLNLKLKFIFIINCLILYFFTSGLGVGNELLELFIDLIFRRKSSSSFTDTAIDLLANTLGSFFGYFCTSIIRWIKSKSLAKL
jgi:hypothetical protein